MAFALGKELKNTLKFTATLGTESTTRSVAGWNWGNSSSPTDGPTLADSLTVFVTSMRLFSSGTLDSFRFVREQGVTL